MALAADEGVGGLDRQRLRKAFSDLDRLRALKSVQECGILGARPIGPMPRLGGNGRRKPTLPAIMREFAAKLDTHGRSRVASVYEVAVRHGVFDQDKDIHPGAFLTPDIYHCWVALLCSEYSAAAAKAYTETVIKSVLEIYPEVMHPDRWVALRRAIHEAAPDLKIDNLSHLATRSGGRAPSELDQVWFDDILRGATEKHTQCGIKSGARIMNGLRDLAGERSCRISQSIL